MCLVARCLRIVVDCVLCDDCCLLFDDRWPLCVVCLALFVVCCRVVLLSFLCERCVGCLLFVVC